MSRLADWGLLKFMKWVFFQKFERPFVLVIFALDLNPLKQFVSKTFICIENNPIGNRPVATGAEE